MFTFLHNYAVLLIDTYSGLWNMCSLTISQIAGDGFASVISSLRSLLENIWIIGTPLSNLLSLLFDTQIIVLVLGSVGLFMAWQLVTWILNLVT